MSEGRDRRIERRETRVAVDVVMAKIRVWRKGFLSNRGFLAE